MKISRGILNHYIGYVTDFYISDNNIPPDELTGYYDYVVDLKTDAIRHEDLESLRLGINYLLCHPEIDLDSHGGMYPYDDEEVREILMYIRSIIWSDNSKVNCEEVKDVELVDINKFDWWKMRKVKV